MNDTAWISQLAVASAALASLIIMDGCAMPARRTIGATASREPVAASSAQAENLRRLSELRAQRQAIPSGDYRIGCGDVLAVKGYDLDELNQKVRVDGDGRVTLPLLNIVTVAGRTVSEVEQDLTERLGAYMYAPRVMVFIEEYRSQQVAVVGAVQHPGLVNQTTPSATVLDTLSAAGGRTSEASPRLFLIPVETRASGKAVPVMSTPDTENGGLPQHDDAIVYDANEMSEEAQLMFLGMPVRGGDVIIVPSTGRFIAEGWVNNPGTYAMQPGLTVRGAIGIAGGLAFPASRNNLRIYRHGAGGETQTLDIDYDAIAAQRVADVFLHEGDVLEVASSSSKLVAYGAYKLVTDLVKIGARITPF